MRNLVLLAFAPFLSAAEPTPLETKVREIAAAHKGKVAVAVKNLATGEHFEINADEVMQTASLIKLAIMVEATTLGRYMNAGQCCRVLTGSCVGAATSNSITRRII